MKGSEYSQAMNKYLLDILLNTMHKFSYNMSII